LCHAGGVAAVDNFRAAGRSKRVGAAFEQRARGFLERERLVFVAANVTVRGGEIDLVMRERDGTLVFVEVRARSSGRYGGAAASIGARKRRRILLAAQVIWARAGGGSACRFDVVAFEAGRLVWLRDAFRADDV
jgi:putative endonuclease